MPIQLLVLLTCLSTVAVADLVFHNEPERYNPQNLGGWKPMQEFKSRSDLHAPVIHEMTYGDPIEAHEDDHFVFAPHGQVVKPWDSGMLLRSRDSSPVWITHDHTPIFNLKVQQFHNSPHLIFWTGMFRDGFGRGNLTIMNQHYEVVTHVRTAEGTVLGDLHEARVTDSDSALIAYQGPQRMQLRGRDNWVRDGCFQDIDIDSGDLLLQWCSSKDVEISESYMPLKWGTQHDVFDYIHLNSVDRIPETGNYLVSGRHTHTVYHVSPEGRILWRLGGKKSDFHFIGDGRFTWQHDVRWVKLKNWNGGMAISIFDNASDKLSPPTRPRSRGILLGLDEDAMTATLLGSFEAPFKDQAGSQGSVQVLEDGNILVGHGQQPHFAIYRPDGTIAKHVQYGMVTASGSFRVEQRPWIGLPKTDPDMVLSRAGLRPQQVDLYLSWNGATAVDTWRIRGVDNPSSPDNRPIEIQRCKRSGFETHCTVWAEKMWIEAQALAANGTVLGSTDFYNRDSQLQFLRSNDEAEESGFGPLSRERPFRNGLSGLLGPWIHVSGHNRRVGRRQRNRRAAH